MIIENELYSGMEVNITPIPNGVSSLKLMDKGITIYLNKWQDWITIEDYCKIFWGINPEIIEVRYDCKYLRIFTSKEVKLEQLNALQKEVGEVVIVPLDQDDLDDGYQGIEIKVKF